MNRRAKPLISHEVIINLIASTGTKSGLRVYFELDVNKYPKGLKFTDQEMEKPQITPHEFYGE